MLVDKFNTFVKKGKEPEITPISIQKKYIRKNIQQKRNNKRYDFSKVVWKIGLMRKKNVN